MSAALENRIKKNAKRLKAWSARENVSCFRIYDRDIPEIPLAVDLYRGVDGDLRVHASVYEPRHGVSEAQVKDWAAAIATSLQIPRDRLFVKRRSPGSAYEKVAERGDRFEVMEGGLRFLVNLTDYVDTGLFLDHRQTRSMVRKESSGKRVLNLFSYTGSFSVYAAAGNASRTVSIDLSPTYSRWAKDNLALNGFASTHEVVVDDVLTFLRAPAADLFDIVVLDPPTVSKSKRAEGDLDVQRDHPFLIERSLARLSKGGTLFFSTNLTNFVLGSVQASFVDEITTKTVPPDFTHRPPPHRCFRIEK